MKFSVVIPLYNKEHYIEATIRSVLNQTCRDFEVLVVDDGSRDNSLALARKFESDRVRIIPQENQGVSVARTPASAMPGANLSASWMRTMSGGPIILPPLMT